MSTSVAHFIADLHLSPAQPATLAAFARYLAGPTRSAGALYILGDLFDAWPGDDALATPAAQAVTRALAALADSGCAIHFLAGNRDFLADQAFADAARLTLLEEPALVELGGRKYLLQHGDALCTDDVAYQKFRTMVRNPVWRTDFLAKPLNERLAIASEARQQSEDAKQVKSYEIMDVNAGAVEACLRAAGYPDLIHGHTHRPGRHDIELDGRHCSRWVLPDWHDKAVWLEWSLAEGMRARSE